MVLVILLLAGVTVFSVSFKEPTMQGASFEQDIQRLRYLHEAKELLIGASFKENKRPGELRKAVGSNPHSNGDGIGTMPNGPGHIPWRQLHASPLSHSNVESDEDREAIWYFLDQEFGTNGGILNYETAANLTIDGQGEYAAVLIAAGEPLNAAQGAIRPSRHYADIAGYLEDENAVDGTTNFVTEAAGDFNDMVLGIGKDELILRAADFAARKFAGRLREYNDDEGRHDITGNGCLVYPAPALFQSDVADDTTPARTSMVSYVDPDDGSHLLVGMAPVSAEGVLPSEWDDCEAGLNPQNVDSFMNQYWFRFIRYARAPGGTGGVGCTSGSNCLVVHFKNGLGGIETTFDDVEALVVMSGYPLESEGQDWGDDPLDEDDFFEGDNADDDEIFEQRPLSDSFNDRLYIVSRSGS